VAGGDYPSLTAIVGIITGTNWNGPRFGLRPAADNTAATPGATAGHCEKRSGVVALGRPFTHMNSPQKVSAAPSTPANRPIIT